MSHLELDSVAGCFFSFFFFGKTRSQRWSEKWLSRVIQPTWYISSLHDYLICEICENQHPGDIMKQYCELYSICTYIKNSLLPIVLQTDIMLVYWVIVVCSYTIHTPGYEYNGTATQLISHHSTVWSLSAISQWLFAEAFKCSCPRLHCKSESDLSE